MSGASFLGRKAAASKRLSHKRLTFVPYHIKSDKGLFCLVTGEIVKLIEKKSNRELRHSKREKTKEMNFIGRTT